MRRNVLFGTNLFRCGSNPHRESGASESHVRKQFSARGGHPRTLAAVLAGVPLVAVSADYRAPTRRRQFWAGKLAKFHGSAGPAPDTPRRSDKPSLPRVRTAAHVSSCRIARIGCCEARRWSYSASSRLRTAWHPPSYFPPSRFPFRQSDGGTGAVSAHKPLRFTLASRSASLDSQ